MRWSNADLTSLSQGDPDALEKLQVCVYSTVDRIAHLKNISEVDKDFLVSHVLPLLLRENCALLSSLSGPKCVNSYVRTMVRRTGNRLLCRQPRIVCDTDLSLGKGPSVIESLEQPERTERCPHVPGSEVINAENLERWTSYLTPSQSDAVRLRILEGMSFSEIAAEIGRSRDAAKKLFRRALDSMERERNRRLGSTTE